MAEQLEEELKDLREKNNELVKKVQHWKMTAAQRENEKLDLMKEMNELRLKLSRMRSGGAAHARKLDRALQTTSEEVLSHLVQASSAVAQLLELNKTYMQERQELDVAMPRWSNLSNTPSSDKVNRVPPMMMGGQLIQPVVSLSRTLHMNARSTPRRRQENNQQNNNVTERAMPMRMLQEVYIPLTRIDAVLHTRSSLEQSDSDTQVEDNSERTSEETQNMSEDEVSEESRRLDSVVEDEEPEERTPPRERHENPLEGPSWLLDGPSRKRKPRSATNSEPDSTTVEEGSPVAGCSSTPTQGGRVSEFTPTVRRRRRSPSVPTPPSPAAPRSPRPRPRPSSNGGRVLKVLVAKMCLDVDHGSGDASPPKRPNVQGPTKRRSPKRKTQSNRTQGPTARESSPSKFLVRIDAPSPNGSTDSRVIVLESRSHSDQAIETDQTGESSEDNSTAVNQNGNDTNQSQTHDDTNGPTLSHSDTNVNHSDTGVIQRDNGVSQRDTGVSQRDTSVNQRDTGVSQRDTGVSQRDTGVSQRDTGVRQRDIFVIQRDIGLSQRDTGVSQRDTSDGQSCVSRDSRDSDSSESEMTEGRTRRPRKAVVYKEKPLNRKLRR